MLLAPTSILAQQNGFSTTSPEKMGFAAAKPEGAQKQMQRYIDEHKLAGIITLIARRNYSGMTRTCHAAGIFFHFEHCASAKKDS